jgi:hypothetical protein
MSTDEYYGDVGWTPGEMSAIGVKADPAAAIALLEEYGHFRNPQHPTGITAKDLPRLSLADSVVKVAFDSYIDFMGLPMEVSSNGKITAEALGSVFMPRCGCADYPAVEYAYPDVVGDALTGRGSWPAGCHPQFPGRHTFTVQVDKRGMPSYLAGTGSDIGAFEQAWRLCVAAYADMGIAFVRQDNDQANTIITFQRGPGWLGLASVPSRFSCALRVWAKFDNRYRPSALVDQWARLIAHELGHNMGMSHFRGGIMNASLTSGVFSLRAWRGDPAESRLRTYFGGTPIILPGPGPGPGPSFDWGAAKIA